MAPSVRALISCCEKYAIRLPSPLSRALRRLPRQSIAGLAPVGRLKMDDLEMIRVQIADHIQARRRSLSPTSALKALAYRHQTSAAGPRLRRHIGASRTIPAA